MRPLRFSINVTVDGCCDHRALMPDAEVHLYTAERLAQADALLFGRVTYELMAAGWRHPAAGSLPAWTEPFAQMINAGTARGQAREATPQAPGFVILPVAGYPSGVVV